MILIVDDMAIFREPIAACLRLAGYQTECATDGKDGLGKARRLKPDLILLDMAMPGIDGLAFLRAMRGDPLIRDIPVIALTAVTDKEYILEARELGIREYLLKSRFRTPELLDRMRKHLPDATQTQGNAAPQPTASPAPTGSAAPRRQSGDRPAVAATTAAPAAAPAPVSITRLLDREECIRRTQRAMEGKTLAGVVTQVMTLTMSPRGDMTQLAELIAQDPMLSAGVLSTANSAALVSTRGPVTTIAEAVRHIGCNGIRNIAAGVGIFEAMPTTAADGFNPIRCWQHSFAVAQICETLMATEGSKGQEQAALAYVVGLCHDLAEILFRTQFGAEYQQVFAAHAATGRPRQELERAILGMTQRQLLLTIAQSIGLPDAIREPIEAFYGGGRTHNPVAEALRLAEHYANGLLLASGGDSVVTAFPRPACRAVTGRDDPPAPDGPTFRSEILGLTGALARLSRAEQQQVMAPLYPVTAARIWLARDAGFSPFDPIEAALASMANVHVASSLPGGTDTGMFDAVVVVARTPHTAGLTAQDMAQFASGPTALPILWLCLHLDDGLSAPPPAGAPAPLKLPFALDGLARFVGQAATQRDACHRRVTAA